MPRIVSLEPEMLSTHVHWLNSFFFLDPLADDWVNRKQIRGAARKSTPYVIAIARRSRPKQPDFTAKSPNWNDNRDLVRHAYSRWLTAAVTRVCGSAS